MSERFHLRCSTRFKVPAAEVWRKKTDLASIEDEFKPWLRVTVQDAARLQAALRGEDLPAQVAGRLWLLQALPGPAWPFEVVEATAWSFKDQSRNALFADWEHEHVIEEASDGCRYLDRVTFTPNLGLPFLSARLVQRLFEHRHRRFARGMAVDERACAVSMLRVWSELQDEGNEGFL